MWFTGMPLYDREAAPFGLRLRWTRSGLVKRLRASTEPSAMDFFLNRQEDREARESSDESAGEKVSYVVPATCSRREVCGREAYVLRDLGV